jgi:alanyl-tRNA synthetase
MDAQRARARSARSTELSMGVQSALLTDIKVESRFVGYDSLEANSELLVIIQDEKLVDSASTGEAQLIFKETPFYAEMGGQVADTGTIVDQSGAMLLKLLM